MITIADAINREFWETALRHTPEYGDIYTASVGTGKIRPVVVIYVSEEEVRYLDCTTRRHKYQRQLVLDGCGLDRQTYIATDQVYSDRRSVLLKKVGRVPATYLRNNGIDGGSNKPSAVKKPYWFKYECGRRYAS